MTDLIQQLRPLRPRLVQAAEAVFEGFRDEGKKLKSQLNHLIAVCNEASCHEEIRLYLRYQSARDNPPIPRDYVGKIIDKIEVIFNDPASAITDTNQRLAAWRLYAVYLARAYTYYDNSKRQQSQDQARLSGDVSRVPSQPQRGRP